MRGLAAMMGSGLGAVWALAGCGELEPASMRAQLYVTPLGAGESTMRAMAILSGDVELPDALVASVNGRRLTGEVENAEGTARLSHATIEAPEPGAAVAFEVTLDGETAVVSARMVQPATLLHQGPPLSLEPGVDHTIAWDVAADGASDWIYFRSSAAGVYTAHVPAGGEHGAAPGMVEVPDGATEVSIPAATIAAWREAAESEAAMQGKDRDGPVTGTVGLLRMTTADASPAFAEGFLVIAAEVASVAVVLQP